VKIFAAFILLAMPLLAQGNIIAIKFGVTKPSTPQSFLTYWRTGFTVAPELEHNIIKGVSVPFEISYTQFIFNDNKFYKDSGSQNNNFEISGGETSSLSICSGLKFYLINKSIFSPYFSIKYGITFWTSDEVNLDNENYRIIINGNKENFNLFRSSIGLNIELDTLFSLLFEADYNLTTKKDQEISTFCLLSGLLIKL